MTKSMLQCIMKMTRPAQRLITVLSPYGSTAHGDGRAQHCHSQLPPRGSSQCNLLPFRVVSVMQRHAACVSYGRELGEHTPVALEEFDRRVIELGA